MGSYTSKLPVISASIGLENDWEVNHTKVEDSAFLLKHFQKKEIDALVTRVENVSKEQGLTAKIIESPTQLKRVLEDLKFFDKEWCTHFSNHPSYILTRKGEDVSQTLWASDEFKSLISENLYQELDQNKDGKISQRELLFAILAYGQNNEIELLRLRYNLLDLDHSSTLTHDEILKWLLSSKHDELKLTRVVAHASLSSMLNSPSSREKMQQAIRLAFDKYSKSVKSKYEEHSQQIVKQFMKINDVNGDGSISFSEFISSTTQKRQEKMRKFTEKLISSENNLLKQEIEKIENDLMMREIQKIMYEAQRSTHK